MRHLIERVLELSEEEQVKVSPNEIPPGQGSEEELQALLESLQPRIRVYGAGGATLERCRTPGGDTHARSRPVRFPGL